ncbi:MAG: alpha,alpha-trehalase [Saprospiraceae bacterium]|jgi:alpha,alpha-trehalase
MKMTILFGGLLVLMTTCNKTENHSDYSPKFQNSWSKVEERILETWGASKVDSTNRQMPGSLEIPYEYFSIYEGVNVLYCWDTYFTNAGLMLVDSFAEYAKNAVDNQFAEIEQIGFVPNASEPWGLNRSQTPFLSMMVREVYENGLADKDWLLSAYEMLEKDYLFWTDTAAIAIEDHNTSIAGLQRFYHHATEKELLDFYKVLAPRFDLSDSLSKEEKLKMGEAWLSEAETMDFTPRFENRCHQFIAVDLNANLYLYEKNFEWMTDELNLERHTDWGLKASQRKELLTKYCWDEERGLFMDYDFVNHRFSKIASVAAFYPLWAGLATEQQAERTLKNLSLFEFDYGPAVCEKSEQEHIYQWDYPAGWPPVYYLVAKALDNYGYKKDARRISAKYLDLVTKNFLVPKPTFFSSKIGAKEKDTKREPGFVYEKYDVVDGTIYDAEYASRPFHGWSYAVYIWCLDYYKRDSINYK